MKSNAVWRFNTAAQTYSGWRWGFRRSVSGNRVYRLRGNRGVELVLADDKHVFIGSHQPSELKAAITKAMDAIEE